MMVTRQGDKSNGADIVLTLAICSSTMQCLMDSTMLCKEKAEKEFSTPELTRKLKDGKGKCDEVDLHKWFLSNFRFSGGGER